MMQEQDEQTSETAQHRWLSGGGAMGVRIREFDWARSPLGPFARWPPALVSTLSICLAARFPMAIYWGRDGYLLYNDAWRPILGQKHPWALGRSAREVWPEIWDAIAPVFEVVWSTGEAAWRGDALLPMQRFGYTEECYFDYTFNPIRGQSGEVEGILNIVQETTYRVLNDRRNRLLREMASRSGSAKTEMEAYDLSMAALATDPADIPFGLLYAIDADGKSAQLIGSTGLSEGHPARPQRFVLGDAADSRGWLLGAVLQRGSTVALDDLNDRFGRLPGGAWPEPTTQALIMPVTLGGQGGRPALFVAGINPRHQLDDEYRHFGDMVVSHIATAVTNARAYSAEKQRAEALAQLDHAKTTFFSNVSHEFRTPLTLMLGPLEDLLAGHQSDLPPAVKGQLELVNRNGLRLLRLVNSLLDFSRIEAGRVQASYVPTDLAAFTSDLTSVFRSATDRAGLNLTVDCRPLDEPVYVDRDMWEKIVMNLLSNAFKFTFEGGITVCLSRQGGHAELRVIDTGVGIPAEALPHVFERFHRVENTPSRTHEGTGIGLALVQELVKLHGGTARVETCVGEGTTFIVTVPFGTRHLPPDRIGDSRTLASTRIGAVPFVEEALRWLPAEATDESPAVSHLPPQPARHAPGHTVLVVDDNTDMRQYIARLLDGTYQVHTVADGRAALELSLRHRPDLIISDVMMPGLDGFGLLNELRARPETHTVPVILLSARAGEEGCIEGLRHGADDYLIKPFNARELLARVDTHVRMAQVRREAAAAVRESEQRFRHMADHAPVMVWVTESDGTCTYLSKSWYDFTGQTPETGLGFGWVQAVHPEDQAGALEAFERANRRHEAFRVEYRLRRYDGEYRWAIDAATPYLSESGEFLGYIGSVLDITDRKRAENVLIERGRQQQLLYELAETVNRAEALADLYDKALDAILTGLQADRASILLFDSDGVMRFKAWRGLPDQYRRAVEGHSPWGQDAVNPAPIMVADIAEADIEPSLREVIQQEGIHALAFVPLTYGGRLLGKFMVYFNRCHSLEPQQLDLAQAIARTLALGIERKAAEAVLRASEERFRGIFENAAMGVALVGLDGKWMRVNNVMCQITGYSRETLLSKTVFEITHPDDLERGSSFMRQLVNGELSDYSIEKRYFRPDGSVVWVSLSVSLQRDVQGRPQYFIGGVADITPRKQAEEAFRQSEERLRTLADQLEQLVEARTAEVVQSQERLRALATELNLTEHRERTRLAAELHDHLAQLLVLGRLKLGQAKRLGGLAGPCADLMKDAEGVLHEALAYTRTLVAGLSPPVLHEFGLAAALRWLATQMERYHLTVAVEAPEVSAWPIPEDRAVLLFQSVRELLINTAKHAGVDRATVRLACPAAGVELEVRDEGRGFDLTAVEQGASGASQFGLFSIRERMKALGGQFEVAAAPGQGTTARLWLPLPGRAEAAVQPAADGQPAGAEAVRMPPVSRGPATGARPIRVLLVDDHAVLREGLRSIVTGYAALTVVGEAGDGLQAIELAGRLEPDVIVMDINMPQLDGIEATRRIRERQPGVAVIGLSIHQSPDVAQRMQEAGAVAYLTKESAADDLCKAIEAAVRQNAGS